MIRGFAERAEALCVISQAVAGNVAKKIDIKILPSKASIAVLAGKEIVCDKPNMII